jgi:hypothetical protein
VWKEEMQDVEWRQQSGSQGGLCAGGRRNRAGQHVPVEEEEREGGPGDLFGNSMNFKDV